MLFGVQRWCFSSIPRVDSPKTLIMVSCARLPFSKKTQLQSWRSTCSDGSWVWVKTCQNPPSRTAVTWFQGIPTGRRVEPCWNCSSENEAQFSQSHCILRLGVEYDITICPTHFSHPCPIISPFRSRSQDCQKMHCYEHPEHSECRGLCRRQAEMKNVERVQCLDQMGSGDDRDSFGGNDGTYLYFMEHILLARV
jgi:hypothetical protein